MIASKLSLCVAAPRANKMYCIASMCASTALEKMAVKSPKIYDLGFEATAPLHSFLKRNKWLADALAIANTAMLFVYVGIPVFSEIFERLTGVGGDHVFLFRVSAALMVRPLVACLTVLPIPTDYIASDGDIPNAMQKDLRFFTFPSGHTAMIYVCAACFSEHWLFYTMFNVVQAIRMVAVRGHYSLDILGGIAIGYVVCCPEVAALASSF